MSDPTLGTAPGLPSASPRDFVATFAVVLVAIVVLLFMDEWLARIDRDESRAHAASLYADGRRRLAEHDADGAADLFASALAMQRANPTYARGLAEALLAGGQPREAEKTLQPVLDRSATDGAANLLMARVLVREGRLEDAKSFYHRAIYGQWPTDTGDRRMATRFELIDLLARQHASSELLAELLPIQDVSPDSVTLRRRLGHLFIEAGSPNRGADVFRKLLQQSPDDGDAYAGMGEAALALGNFRTARADLAIASRLRPRDSAVANRLALADTALALDPTARGIGDRERAARSRRLLALTLDMAGRCSGSRAAPPLALADSARRMLAAPAPTRDEASYVEAMQSLAASLAPGDGACGASPSVTEQAVRLIEDKVAG